LNKIGYAIKESDCHIRLSGYIEFYNRCKDNKDNFQVLNEDVLYTHVYERNPGDERNDQKVFKADWCGIQKYFL